MTTTSQKRPALSAAMIALVSTFVVGVGLSLIAQQLGWLDAIQWQGGLLASLAVGAIVYSTVAARRRCAP